MKQSYLENIGGGHHKHIAPFVFHCETEMRIKADKKLEELNSKFSEANLKWNILVIDDYAKTNLKPIIEDEITEKSPTKKNIINKILKKGNDIKDEFDYVYTSTSNKNVLSELKYLINNKIIIKELAALFNIDKTKKVFDEIEKTLKNKEKVEEFKTFIEENAIIFNDECEKKIIKKIKYIYNNKKQYDIFLLDYLLGETTEGTRELGSDLFTNPNYKNLSENKGPLGKFWIFPITAFSKAMTDKIRSSGISHIHDDWYLFDGADPIATPQLFRYNFYKLLELQLNQAIVEKNEIIDFVMNNKQIEEDNLRINARRMYGMYMHKFGMHEALKIDAKNNSKFAKSIIKYLDTSNNGFENARFYENIRKLLYFVGYGTHYDRLRMWDVLQYIKQAIPDDKKEETKKFIEIVSKYISDLS